MYCTGHFDSKRLCTALEMTLSICRVRGAPESTGQLFVFRAGQQVSTKTVLELHSLSANMLQQEEQNSLHTLFIKTHTTVGDFSSLPIQETRMQIWTQFTFLPPQEVALPPVVPHLLHLCQQHLHQQLEEALS